MLRSRKVIGVSGLQRRACVRRVSCPQQIHRDSRIRVHAVMLAARRSPLFTAIYNPALVQSGSQNLGDTEREALMRRRRIRQTPFVLLERTGHALFRPLALLR
jgi:hypothetical protein